MPTYKYRREDGTTFEVKQKITEDALEECPDTGQPVERVITGGMGFQLKGGGWYSDGYASADGAAAKESSGSSGDASGNGESGDAKKASDKTSDAGTKEKASPKQDSAT